MKTLTKSIIVPAVSILLISSIALAQSASSSVSTAPAQTRSSVSSARGRSSVATGRSIQMPSTISSSNVSYRNWPYESGSTEPILIIPSAEMEAKDLLMINEDLNIMSRIFESALHKVHITPSSGSNIFVNDSNRNYFLTQLSGREKIKSIYIQDYGVIFMMSVNFPLSPSPEKQETNENEQKDNGDDEVWQSFRTQIYEPEKISKPTKIEMARSYDANKVDALKNSLIQSLKHASNIRNLKNEEFVILSITGSGGSAEYEALFVESDDTSSKDKILLRDKSTGKARWVEGNSTAELALSSRTVLVIRAKKDDIDNLTKGDIEPDQFRQRVSILSHPYLGGSSSRGSDLFHYNVISTTKPSQ